MSASTEQRRLLKLRKKIEITKQKLIFLRKCKRNKVKPKFIQVRTCIKNSRTKSVIECAERMWLILEIKYHYASLQNIERKACEIHLRMTKKIITSAEKVMWENFETWMHEVVHTEAKNSKINENQDEQSDTFIKDFVQNFSSVELNEKELHLLNKGLKFCLPRTKPPIDELLVDIMASTEKLMEEESDEINEESLRAIKKLKGSYKTDKNATGFINTAKGLKKKPIFISKADKSNNVVVLDKEDYKNRMLQMIEESEYELIEKDPLGTMKSQVDRVLKEHGNVLCIDPKKELRKWKISNPKVPRLYDLAKTHKPKDLNSSEGLKMRPVVSNLEAPTEKVAKWLAKEFKKMRPPKGKSVKNALEFVKAIENVRLKKNETMGSYDVVALYPSIPMNETMILFKKWLIENNVSLAKMNMYMALTKLCMDQNILMYNGAYHIQRDGTAIGNAMSGFMAEIYMCAFETKIEKHKDFPRVYVYGRHFRHTKC